MRSWTYALAVVLVGATLAFTQARIRLPETAPESPLADLPETLGSWKATRELPLDAEELELLQLSDYVSRVYMEPEQGAVLIYVGYYRSQRTGATYHSPLNCLPGSGWYVQETDYVAVPGAPTAQVKRLVIGKETQRSVVLYWYHDRGRVITNEYAAKAYLIWDGLRWNRTDGALVRITVPVDTSVEAATERGLSFLGDFWPVLHSRLPPPQRS